MAEMERFERFGDELRQVFVGDGYVVERKVVEFGLLSEWHVVTAGQGRIREPKGFEKLIAADGLEEIAIDLEAANDEVHKMGLASERQAPGGQGRVINDDPLEPGQVEECGELIGRELCPIDEEG